MEIFVDGTLPVAITVLDGQAALKIKKFRMRAITAAEAIMVQSNLKPYQYTGYAEIFASVDLISSDDKIFALEYDSVMASSSQNLRYLEDKKAELNAKEQAES